MTGQLVTGGPVGGPAAPKKSRKVLWISLGSVAALLLLIGVINGVNRPTNSSLSSTGPGAEAETTVKTPAPDPEPEMVVVPVGLAGMAARDAEAALEAVGLKAAYDGEPTAKVLSVSPSAAELEVGSTVTLTVEQPPQLTLSQRNAIGSAESYLNYTNFSRSGLIGQLEYEGYSVEDATFAVDFVNPDWNAQAAGSAQSYLDFTSFSRDGLYEQLIYEGFTPEQANAGLAAVGY
jgi:hypothetical protein